MKKILRYQCFDLVKALIVYYIAITAIMAIAINGVRLSDNSRINGIGFSSEFFCFIVGLCLFREYFYLFMQNGSSRKLIFKGACSTIALLSVAMSVMDTLFLYILDTLSLDNVRYMTLSSFIYSSYMTSLNPAVRLLIDLVITFLVVFIFFSAGYLISVLFYRSSKPVKILIAAGLPLLIVGGIPVLAVFYPDIFAAIIFFLLFILGIINGNPFIGMLTLTIAAVIINALSYLAVRGAEI